MADCMPSGRQGALLLKLDSSSVQCVRVTLDHGKLTLQPGPTPRRVLLDDQTRVVKLNRSTEPLGITLEGGAQFSCPVFVSEVWGHSPHAHDVFPGDVVDAVDSTPCGAKSHREVSLLIKQSIALTGSCCLTLRQWTNYCSFFNDYPTHSLPGTSYLMHLAHVSRTPDKSFCLKLFSDDRVLELFCFKDHLEEWIRAMSQHIIHANSQYVEKVNRTLQRSLLLLSSVTCPTCPEPSGVLCLEKWSLTLSTGDGDPLSRPEDEPTGLRAPLVEISWTRVGLDSIRLVHKTEPGTEIQFQSEQEASIWTFALETASVAAVESLRKVTLCCQKPASPSTDYVFTISPSEVTLQAAANGYCHVMRISALTRCEKGADNTLTLTFRDDPSPHTLKFANSVLVMNILHSFMRYRLHKLLK